MPFMSSRLKISVTAIGLIAVILAGASLYFQDSPSEQEYTLEIVPSTESEAQMTIPYENLNESQKDEFMSVKSSVKHMNSEPYLYEYSGEYISYNGSVYHVVVSTE